MAPKRHTFLIYWNQVKNPQPPPLSTIWSALTNDVQGDFFGDDMYVNPRTYDCSDTLNIGLKASRIDWKGPFWWGYALRRWKTCICAKRVQKWVKKWQFFAILKILLERYIESNGAIRKIVAFYYCPRRVVGCGEWRRWGKTGVKGVGLERVSTWCFAILTWKMPIDTLFWLLHRKERCFVVLIKSRKLGVVIEKVGEKCVRVWFLGCK